MGPLVSIRKNEMALVEMDRLTSVVDAQNAILD